MFPDYFGKKLYQPPKENYMTPSVDIIRTNIRLQDGVKIPWPERVTNLLMNPEYQHIVAMTAAAYAAQGHKVLVVSDRVSMLKTCANLIGDNAICITGDVPHQEREEQLKLISTGEKEVLCGTKSIFSEGYSENALSCLIIGSPMNNEPQLTQLIGRVIRLREGKRKPKIVDFSLLGNTARRQLSARVAYYIRMGYNIREI